MWNKINLGLIIILIAGAFLLVNADWYPLEGGQPNSQPVLDILNSTPMMFSAQLLFGGFEYRETVVSGGTFLEAEIPGCSYSITQGAPRLPVYRQLLEIPSECELNWQVVSVQYQQISLSQLGMAERVFPLQPSVPKIPGAEKDIKFIIDEKAYNNDDYSPSDFISVAKGGIMRGHHLARLEIAPIKYNPVQKKLIVLTSITFNIDFQKSSSGPVEIIPERYYNPYFDYLLERTVINYAAFEPLAVPDIPAGLLIITTTTFEPGMQPYVEWKTQKGYYVTLATTATIGGSSTALVKNYIQNAYDSWTIPPSFVLIVGDVEYVNCHTGTQADNPPTDLYYATLEGSDYFPDVGIGRFSVNSLAQTQAIVSKIVGYETNYYPSGSGFLDNAYFMASNDGSFHGVAEATNNYCISVSRSAGMTCDSLYYYYGSGTAVATAINNGRTIAVYTGHGSETAWGGPPFSQANVNSLTNSNRYPLICSHACLTGDIAHSSECFGETWIRASNKGAANFWGSSVTSLWDEDDILQRRFFDGVFSQHITWLSGMCDYAKLQLYNAYGGGGYTHRYYEMYNILGDPTFDLYTAIPQEMVVNYPSSIYTGPQTLDITVSTASAMAPIQDALVCGYKAGDTQGVAYSNASGHALVNVEPTTAGQLILTVSKHNYQAFQCTITVASMGAASLIRPFDNAKIGQAGSSPTPTLVWDVPDNPGGGSFHFKVEWDNDADFSSPLATIESRTNTAGFTPAPPIPEGTGVCAYVVNSQGEGALTNGQTYWWRVAPYSTLSGTYGPWSDSFSFTIDNSYSNFAWHQTTDEQFDRDIMTDTETYGSDQVRLQGGVSGTAGVDPSCADAYYTYGANYEFYSLWTIPGSGTVTVTRIWIYDGNASIDPGDQIHIALYQNGSGYGMIAGSQALVTGADAVGWIGADVTTPFEITLGSSYWVGIAPTSGSFYRIYRDENSNCSGYPPNGVGSYYQSSNNTLDSNVPTGASQSDHKYIIPGISYESGSETGTIVSQTINHSWVFGSVGWDELLFSDNETTGDIKYSIQYWDGDSWENSTVVNQDVSPVDLNALNPATYGIIRILGDFSDVGGSPYLQDWTVTWRFQQLMPITIVTSGLNASYPAQINYVDDSGPQTASTFGTWEDSCQVGTVVSIEQPVPGASNVRYATQDSTSWTVSGADTFYVDYTEQYQITIEPQVAPGGLALNDTNQAVVTRQVFGASAPEFFYETWTRWLDSGSNLTVSGYTQATTSFQGWRENAAGEDLNYTVDTPGETYIITYYHQYYPHITLLGTDAAHPVQTINHVQFGASHLEGGLFGEWYEWTDRGSELTFSDTTLSSPPRVALDTTSWTVFSAFRDTIVYAAYSNVTVQTSFGGDSVTVDGIAYPSPYNATWAPGSQHIIEVDSFCYLSEGERYQFTSWSDYAGIVDTVVAYGDTTLTAEYIHQYRLQVFNPGGYDSPVPGEGDHWFSPGCPIGGFVTSPDDTMYCIGYYGTGSAPDSAFETNFNFMLEEPSSIQWRWVGASSMVQLVVYSRYGDPHPSDTTLFPAGMNIVVYVDDSAYGDGRWQYCTGWWADGSAPPAGDTSSFNFTITENTSIVWQWDIFLQFPLIIHSEGGYGPVIPGEGIHWYSSGDSVTGHADSPDITMYCVGYTGTGSAPSGTETEFDFLIFSPSSITWHWESGAGGVVSLTVYSEYGNPHPAGETVHYFPEGTNIYSWVSDSVFEGGTWHYCTGWIGYGSVPPNGDSNLVDFILTENSVIVWQWAGLIRFPFMVSNPGGPSAIVPPEGIHWYDEGALVEGYALSPDDTMYCIGYYGWGSLPDSSSENWFEFNLNEPTILEWRWSSGAGGVVELVVYSPFGSPHPEGTLIYPIGTNVYAYIQDSVFTDSLWHYCTGWLGYGSVPPTGSSNELGFVITENSVMLWLWDEIERYPFIVLNPGGWGLPDPGEGIHWYETGAEVTGSNVGVDDTMYCFGYQGWGALDSAYELSFDFIIDRISGVEWVWIGESEVLQLEVVSEYGVPDPPEGLYYYAPGTPITAWVNDSIILPGERHVCLGWSGSGSIPSIGDSSIVSFIIEENSTLTWLWFTEYYISLTYSRTDSLVPWQIGEGWYEEGTWASIVTQSTVPGPEWDYTFAFWHSGLPILDSTDASTSVLVANSCSIDAEYMQQVLCTIYKDPAHTAGNIVVDGVPIAGVSNVTVAWREGSIHTIGVSTHDSTALVMFNFSHWDIGDTTATITVGPVFGDTVFTAFYDRMFFCTIQKDPPETLGWLEVDRTRWFREESAERSFWWEEGSYHEVDVSFRDTTAWEFYRFKEWENADVNSYRDIGPITGPSTYTAYYNAKYRMTIKKQPFQDLGWISVNGTVHDGIFFLIMWAWKDSTYEIMVSDPDSIGDTMYTFLHWDDSISSPAFTTSPVLGPSDYTAYYRTRYRCNVSKLPPEPFGWLEVDTIHIEGAASASHDFWLAEDSVYIIRTSSPDYVDTSDCERYKFLFWEDSSPVSMRMVGPIRSPRNFTATYQKQYLITIAKAPAESLGWISVGGSAYNNVSEISFWGFEGSVYNVEVSQYDVGEFEAWEFYEWTDSRDPAYRTIDPLNRCTTYVALYNPVTLEISLDHDWWDIGLIGLFETVTMEDREVVVISNETVLPVDLGLRFDTVIDTLTGDTVAWSAAYLPSEDQFVLKAIFNDFGVPPTSFHQVRDLVGASLRWATEGDDGIYGPGGTNLSSGTNENLWFQFNAPTESSIYVTPLEILVTVMVKIHLY
ncbi:hypothetical protein JW877_06170 [bacterium]|nr:hypothetical protein [bacterium]